MKSQRYAVIMAGGKGVRFWPLSRPHRPKQLLKLIGDKTLLRATVDRILPVFGRENTLVVTAEEHHLAVRKELALLPRSNFLIEPQGNNTAPCIGLAAVELMARDANAVMVVLPADHWISDKSRFYRTLNAATRLAEKTDALLTIGIRPDYPETGYGYIVKGKPIRGPRGSSAYRVKSFQEKPALAKARRLLALGSLWNSGIFAWRAATILTMLRRFAPSVYDGLEKIRKEARGGALGKANGRPATVIRSEYKKMTSISIDHAVLENAAREGSVFTLQADFGWSDVGSWAAVHRMLPKDREGNAGVGKWVGFKSKNSLVYAPHRLVAILGTQDIVVIDTPDAVLVADIHRSQDVKNLVEELARQGFGQYTRG